MQVVRVVIRWRWQSGWGQRHGSPRCHVHAEQCAATMPSALQATWQIIRQLALLSMLGRRGRHEWPHNHPLPLPAAASFNAEGCAHCAAAVAFDAAAAAVELLLFLLERLQRLHRMLLLLLPLHLLLLLLKGLLLLFFIMFTFSKPDVSSLKTDVFCIAGHRHRGN